MKKGIILFTFLTMQMLNSKPSKTYEQSIIQNTSPNEITIEFVVKGNENIKFGPFPNFVGNEYKVQMNRLKEKMDSNKKIKITKIIVKQHDAKSGYIGFNKNKTKTYKNEKINTINQALKNIIIDEIPKEETNKPTEDIKSANEFAPKKYSPPFLPKITILENDIEINFKNQNFKNSKIKNKEILNSSLEKANLEESNIKNCNFINNDFSKANLNNSEIKNTIFRKNILNQTTFWNAELNKCTLDENQTNKASFEGTEFNECKIIKSKYINCNFKYSEFTLSSIENGVFESCNFEKAKFEDTTFKDVEFKNCDGLTDIQISALKDQGAIIN
jgi:fluoroquinolone resistance protein